MSVKKVVFNDSTGMVFVENSDGSTNKFNIADAVTATTSPSGGVVFDPAVEAAIAELA